MPREPMPDVVVVIPGLLGSVLRRDGKDVWGLSKGAVFRGLMTLGKSIDTLAVADDDPAAPTLDDGVVASRLMPDTHLVPGLWKIDGYTKLCRYVKETFDVAPGANYFEFPYDWRRDVRSSARRLRVESARWLREWRTASGNGDAKLVILAHSLGGIVARVFAALEGGAPDIRRLITFGAPHRGSVNALNYLANGWRKGVGPITLVDLTATLRTFTSLHQLLPVYQCIVDGSGEPQRVADLSGIEGVDQQLAKEGMQLMWEVSEVTADLDTPYDTRVIVGTELPTLQGATRAAEDPSRLVATRHCAGEDRRGDGTVPRVAAFPLEWGDEKNVFYAADAHAALQNADEVLRQVEGVLTATKLDRYRAGREGTLSLDLRDWYRKAEPVTVCLRQRPVFAQEPHTLRTRVWNVDTGGEVANDLSEVPPDAWKEVELPPVSEGVYRVRMEAADGFDVDSVDDLCLVVDEA